MDEGAAIGFTRSDWPETADFAGATLEGAFFLTAGILAEAAVLEDVIVATAAFAASGLSWADFLLPDLPPMLSLLSLIAVFRVAAPPFRRR